MRGDSDPLSGTIEGTGVWTIAPIWGRSGTVTATGRSRQLVAIAFTRLVRPGGPTTVSFDTARLNPT